MEITNKNKREENYLATKRMEKVLIHDPIWVQPFPLVVPELEDKRSLMSDDLRGVIIKDELISTIAKPENLPCIAIRLAPTFINIIHH